MSAATAIRSHGEGATRNEPRFIFHASFEEPCAEDMFGAAYVDNDDHTLAFMPDDVTRDCTKRMHYAAWRAHKATTKREETRWRRRYYACRDCIVLGNRKLTYRAVHKWNSTSQSSDDLAGECQIVLIKAVAAFNPWLGIRFSTYAFTCLMRALSRLSQRQAADKLRWSLPLESLRHSEPCYVSDAEPASPRLAWLCEYLRNGGALLTPREKIVLTRRFHLTDEDRRSETLEQVGRGLGLSKERVRQVQKSALGKLRDALLAGTAAS